MAQSHLTLRALAARQGQDIRASRCRVFFPLTPALSLGMCLALKPSVGQGRGIYPAGTPALQIRVGEFQGPFATQPSCGLKSALRSLAQ